MSRDGVCLTTVGLLRKERAKKEELAVEPAERSAALTATHEARPVRGAAAQERDGLHDPRIFSDSEGSRS